MKKSWKPIASGLLSIIAGVNGIVIGVMLLMGNIYFMYEAIEADGIAVLLVFSGALAIIGGITAIFRKKRWLAFTGVVLAIPSGAVYLSILGILSIVFLILSKSEFK